MIQWDQLQLKQRNRFNGANLKKLTQLGSCWGTANICWPRAWAEQAKINSKYKLEMNSSGLERVQLGADMIGGEGGVFQAHKIKTAKLLNTYMNSALDGLAESAIKMEGRGGTLRAGAETTSLMAAPDAADTFGRIDRAE